MKLQTRVTVVLLAGLISIYLASSLFQRCRSLNAIKRFSSESREGETKRQWEWVQRIQHATYASLEDAMSAGDMDKFQKILAAQRDVNGLQELSQG
jgi:hypothetical protein